jgi:hypothetical protein
MRGRKWPCPRRYAKGLYKYYTELELEESSVCDQSNLREGNKIHNKLAIHVSPNPTSSLIHVYTPQDGNLKIYDLSQQLLYEDAVISQNDAYIDVSNYKPGIYLVNFISDNGNLVVKKFIKI